MTLRVTLAYVKSDQVKQSENNLEKYRLFTKDKLKLFICKVNLTFRKIMQEGEMYDLLTEAQGKEILCQHTFSFWL